MFVRKPWHCFGNVQRQDFSPGTGVWNFSLNPEGSRALPYPGHESIAARSVGKSRSKSSEYFVLVQVPYLRMNDESQPCLPVVVFLLDKLIVTGAPTKFKRQSFFSKLKEVTVEEIHALARKFLKTS